MNKTNKLKIISKGHKDERISYLHVRIMEKLFKRFSKSSYQEITPIINKLENKNKLLEIGCGEGDFSFEMSKSFDNVVGIDIIESYVETAKKRKKQGNYSNVTFYNKDIENLKMKEEFDVIICLNTLEYIYDPYLLMLKIRKLLKPGGTIIFSVPNLAFLHLRLRLLFGKLPTCSLTHSMKSWDSGILHYYTKKEFVKFIKSTDFEIKEVTTSGYFNRIRKIWISLLGWDIIIVAQKKD